MSTLPSASRFLCSGGVLGFVVSHGSMTITFPVGVVILVADCPSHWTSTLALWAHAGPAASVKVMAPANFRKSRRCISMCSSLYGLPPSSSPLRGEGSPDFLRGERHVHV